MGKHEKQTYLNQIKQRYKRASKAAKQHILDEFCAVCGYNRKYAIRVLNRAKANPRPHKAGRKPTYDREVILEPLKRIWLATDQMCSKKLAAAIPLWLPFYEDTYGALDQSTQHQLGQLSPATIDRLLKPTRLQTKAKGLCGTQPGSLLRNQIPIRTHAWDITQPGFMEADTVAHCGNTLAGNFVWSLTMTDYVSGWTECRATWNKGAHGVLEQIKCIEDQLPFALKGFDCDNGSEFLNHHLVRYFQQHPKGVHFTRSRPYKKNDNAHVEQKNWTHVRHLFGYDRFDKPSLVALMNDLYRHEWSLLQNYFCPTMKLKDKQRVNSKYKRQYHPPETPYQRLIRSEHISDNEKDKLNACYQTLNPFKLQRQIQEKLTTIFKHIKVTSNVRQRL